MGALVLLFAVSCTDAAPVAPRADAGPRAGVAPPEGVARDAADGGPARDGGSARAAVDGGAGHDGVVLDGGEARVVLDGGGARDGAGATAGAFGVKCRPASAPSWPAVAWIGDAPAVAFYDGDGTRVARVPDGDARALSRIAVMVAGGGATAAPGLAGRAGAGLLATIEGPVPQHRLLVRLVDAHLAARGPERSIAESVDSRFGPAVVAFGGGWLAGWIDASGEVGRAMVRRLAEDGAPLDDAQVLSEAPTGAASLALSTHEGRALAAWIDPHLGFSPVVAAWSDTEGRFGAPRIITTTSSVDRSAMVSVAAGPGESGLLVWAHVGGLGQDFLTRTLLPRGAAPARPEAVDRVDAYATLRAAAFAQHDRFALAWDMPTATGRAPPTSVRLQWLGAPGEPLDLGPGGGVTTARDGDGELVLAFRRGMSVCVAQRTE